ncbi:acyl-CoA carboxylase epsilon subunit-like protein [Streptomyces sp. TLI_55]|uniref:acyl-CoA carboxylase subunit epsilon n=1 Tax=Streptomyces sp. TLI_55 TaxID=1938861 RepID=UPI000BDB81C7|nr:acyl-CoA carboxylase subunit epsilon [Streptomyces sp. TLI_55]SNX62664.1 acyl-CoA carboxylase epsilon subunit-like protein [Streptomyces sp. TLI_55]
MSDTEGPLLRVERGDPSPEELAAATAVLLELARRAPAAEEPAPARTAAPTWHRPALTAHRAAASWRH